MADSMVVAQPFSYFVDVKAGRSHKWSAIGTEGHGKIGRAVAKRGRCRRPGGQIHARPCLQARPSCRLISHYQLVLILDKHSDPFIFGYSPIMSRLARGREMGTRAISVISRNRIWGGCDE